MAHTALAHFLASNLALISLIALVIAVALTIWKDINLGITSLGLSLLIGTYLGGTSVKHLVSGFPTSILLMLAGTTYLFGIAQTNGTLDKMTKYAIKSVRGNVAVLPIILFFLAFILSSMGPGQIPVATLLAVPVMAIAEEVGVSPLLMALVVGNGAQAGAMSPVSPTGVIAAGILQKWGGVAATWSITLWMNMLITHTVIAIIAYVLFGGLKLLKRTDSAQSDTLKNMVVEPFTRKQWITLVGILALIVGVLGFKVDVGFGAFLIGTILILFKVGDEKAAIKSMPWGTIMMVTGVTVLVNLMASIGGIKLFASIIAHMSTPSTATLVVGFWSGLVSAYTSTSAFIIPSFLPMVDSLAKQLGMTSPAALLSLVSTVIVSGHLTDLSPLSTTGAVFIGQAGPKTDKKKLFSGMMAWGLSMSVVGAVISWLFFTVLRIP